MDPEKEFLTLTLRQEVAKSLGVEEAIMLNHIAWWCNKNEENNSTRHFHQDRYWTYYSKKALANFFGFWTEAQVKRILDKLIDQNYLLKGRFNRKGYDKTCWYTPVTRMSTLTEEIAEPEE